VSPAGPDSSVSTGVNARSLVLVLFEVMLVPL
jgi:hypothetical protein